MSARAVRGACPRGTRYRNIRVARAAIDTLNNREVQRYRRRLMSRLWPVHCTQCAGWHMTHLNPNGVSR